MATTPSGIDPLMGSDHHVVQADAANKLNPTNPVQTHSHVFTGLVPGAQASLVDNLRRVYNRITGKASGQVVRSFTVGENGQYAVTGLRDSIYSVIYKNIKWVGNNQYNISIGNPDLFNVVSQYLRPSPPRLLSVEDELDGETPAVRITWSPSPTGDVTIVRVQYKLKTSETWSTFETIYDKLQTNTLVTPVEFDTEYDFRLVGIAPDGSNRGASTVLTLTTQTNPHEDDFLDLDSLKTDMTTIGVGSLGSRTGVKSTVLLDEDTSSQIFNRYGKLIENRDDKSILVPEMAVELYGSTSRLGLGTDYTAITASDEVKEIRYGNGYIWGVAFDTDQIVRFSRNGVTGEISETDYTPDGAGALNGPHSLCYGINTSDNTKHLYVLDMDSIKDFDITDGSLTFNQEFDTTYGGDDFSAIDLGGGASVGGGRLIQFNMEDQYVYVIWHNDDQTRREVTTFDITDGSIVASAFDALVTSITKLVYVGNQIVWVLVAEGAGKSVFHLKTSTGTFVGPYLTEVFLIPPPCVFDGQYIWSITEDSAAGTCYYIRRFVGNLVGGAVAEKLSNSYIDLGSLSTPYEPLNIGFDGINLWVYAHAVGGPTTYDAYKIFVVNPRTLECADSYDIPKYAGTVAPGYTVPMSFDGDRMWITHGRGSGTQYIAYLAK